MKFLVNGKNITDNLLVIEIRYKSHYPRFISILTKLTTHTQELTLIVSPAPKKDFSFRLNISYFHFWIFM